MCFFEVSDQAALKFLVGVLASLFVPAFVVLGMFPLLVYFAPLSIVVLSLGGG